MIDIDKPLEAVNINTGHVVSVAFVEKCDDGTDDIVIAGIPDGFEVFRPDGRPWVGHDCGCDYRVRNVKA